MDNGTRIALVALGVSLGLTVDDAWAAAERVDSDDPRAAVQQIVKLSAAPPLRPEDVMDPELLAHRQRGLEDGLPRFTGPP